jgi:pseudouridine-5'-phosphate glycosidase
MTERCDALRWPAIVRRARLCAGAALDSHSTDADRYASGVTTTDLLLVHPEVQRALDEGAAVVALESTITTHGLPRPDNLAAARMSEAAVRGAGAIPATVATRDGRLLIGLDDDALAELADARDIPKVSRQNLAGVLAQSGWGGTTVSATMIAAHLAGIAVFATGGIGGVHRGGESSMDISADLAELARTPVTVVCAGPKSILDVGRTLEALETRGVPVVAWGSDDVAGFYSRSSGFRARLRVDSPAEAARLITTQRCLGLETGVLITLPLPDDIALAPELVSAAVDRAEADALAAGIHGPASTPFVLARVAEITEGRSVRANLEIIERDAALAGRIAVALAAAP